MLWRSSTESSFLPSEHPDFPDDRCPTIGDDADIISSFSGYGHATHLSHFTWSSSHCTSLSTGVYGDGFMTIIAANGDVLEATYADGLVLQGFPVVPIVDQLSFVDGGTGRFTHASGGVSEIGTFNFDTLQVNLEWSGSIAYRR